MKKCILTTAFSVLICGSTAISAASADYEVQMREYPVEQNGNPSQYQQNQQYQQYGQQNSGNYQNQSQNDQGSADVGQDKELSEEINRLVKGSYKTFGVNVEVNNGVVTLTGLVGSDQDKQNIERDVARFNNVGSVDNKLQEANFKPDHNTSFNERGW
jgi:osmotically-inducible protein OsmY